ncbi:putative AlkP superfamily pyrophosphatase or phosphodiesterase [Parasphingopyxis lamellibrachiae]|uniref:Putative AlkP superfamily pyrophosphatase or phosphodiesterase n=2 Tax=Parasphingopyxis lamellibrachiae TaxID=680125 RepID=A0A3D9FDX2_9SPHN|nr:putative AlkP superfamily pyrophosphatase or phosphodiesterase [Parasphingopyxis lamellibrachiae]
MHMIRSFFVLIALFGAVATQAQTPVPVTILISIDGFRPDYLDRGITPRLSALRETGIFASMRPSFPTKTFPNHYTIVTGLRPDHHGITGNSMIDPARPGQMFSLGNPAQSLDPFWWDQAEPIWVTAENAGIRTGTMFWPGSEVAIRGVRPQDWQRFDQNVSNIQRVNAVLDWQRRPETIRPRFVTLYFDTVDMAGHIHGISASETDAAIAEVDTRIGELVDGLAAMDRLANIVIISDHGMRTIDAARVIQLDELIDPSFYTLVESGPYAAIEPAAGTDDHVFETFIQPHDNMTCTRREEVPAHLEFGANPRATAILCRADAGWVIISGEPRYPIAGATHGWDNFDPEMRATFLANGPAFVREAGPGIVDNVDVYTLLSRLIGIEPLPNDGDPAVADALLND